MKKRVLMVATVPSMIGQFNMNNVKILQELGYEVDVAADYTDTSCWPAERVERFKQDLEQMNVRNFQVNFSRSMFRFNRHIQSYKEILKLMREQNYSFIHTHTPIASAVVRLAAHKTRTKVIYTAHGFHFYNGAPIKNWIVFYPVEKWLSKYTDVLITINKEDYKRAKEHFRARKTVYIPGVGVDTKKFVPRESGRERIRFELGLSEDKLLLLSVGELNENKNHESVIRAIRGVSNITYAIVGKGELKGRLEEIANDCGVDLRLMGFRTDVADFYDAADVYILPSLREGLNVSLMEAMASSLLCLAGKIRGNVDLIDEDKGGYLFSPKSEDEIRKAITKMDNLSVDERKEKGEYNLQKIKKYDLQTVEKTVSEIYQGGHKHLLDILRLQQKRIEIGVPLDCKLLISVGELSVRKNHKVVVKALQKLSDEFWYVIVGKGDLRDELMSLDQTGRLKLLGFRTDIVDLLHCSDLFVFPSLQEGLPVALMEAIVSNIPCIASDIRGNEDLITDNNYLFDAQNYKSICDSIIKTFDSNKEHNNLSDIKQISVEEVSQLMKKTYLD